MGRGCARLREITPGGSRPRLWRERRARGGGGGARALVRGARVVEAAGVGRRLLWFHSGSSRVGLGAALRLPPPAAARRAATRRGGRPRPPPSCPPRSGLRSGARGSGSGARVGGQPRAPPRSGACASGQRRDANRADGVEKGGVLGLGEGGRARRVEPGVQPPRQVALLVLRAAGRGVRCGQGRVESWKARLGGWRERRSRAVAERCERIWSGRCGDWQGGDASGGAAARTGGRELGGGCACTSASRSRQSASPVRAAGEAGDEARRCSTRTASSFVTGGRLRRRVASERDKQGGAAKRVARGSVSNMEIYWFLFF